MIRYSVSIFIMIVTITAWASPNVHQHQDSPLRNALITGTDTDGKILYLCQGKLFNSIQPGKTWAGYGRCNVPYGGKEYVLNHFSIPNKAQLGHINWENNHQSAIVMGKDTNNNPLFVCQTNFNGSAQPGKTWPGYNHCNISYAGREIIMDNYRILSRNREIIVRSQPSARRHSNAMHSHY